jgi:hypothetical protein
MGGDQVTIQFASSAPAQRFTASLISGTSPGAVVARAVEASVFGEKFGNTLEDLQREYGDYDARSRFLLVSDNGEPAGVLRVATAVRLSGLKTIRDVQAQLGVGLCDIIQHHGMLHAPNVLDVGTLAVRKSWRGDGYVASVLYGLLHQHCLRGGYEHMVAVVDSHAYRILTDIGVPFVPLAGTKPFSYLGSPSSVACYARVAELGPSAEARLSHPALRTLMRRMVYGEGLPEVAAL